MKISDMDIYHLPEWMGKIVDEIEDRGRNELLKESPQYARMDEESKEILDYFEFISTLIDRDKITTPMDMGITEAKALSRFLALENDMNDLLKIQIYLMGCRHTVQFLRFAGLL